MIENKSKRMRNPLLLHIHTHKNATWRVQPAIRAGRECAAHNPGCDVVVCAEGCTGQSLAPYKLKRSVPTSNLTVVSSQQVCNLPRTHQDCCGYRAPTKSYIQSRSWPQARHAREFCC